MNLKTNLFSKKIYSILILIVVITTHSCKKDSYNALEKAPFLQGNGYGFNSAIFSVKDIDSTKKYFSEKLGFNFQNSKSIEKGMIEGTLSSSIDFPDMSSIELFTVSDTIAVTSKDSLMRNFLNQKEGMRMYSISSSSIDSTDSWLKSQGFKMDTIHTYLVKNAYSNQEAWDINFNELVSVGFERTPEQEYLPQFTQKMSFPYGRMHEWTSFYNMQRGFMQHPNGVVAIKAISIVVKDLEEARKQFVTLGLTELDANPSSTNSVRFKVLRNQELEIVAPQSNDDPLSLFLGADHSKVQSIRFEVKNIDETHAFLQEKLPENALELDSLTNQLTVLKEYALGVDFEFMQESEEQGLVAEQLKLNWGTKLDSVARNNANRLYQKYCSLCHGVDREGYVADNAPSLRSNSLLATSKGTNFMRYTIKYGRGESAMAGYYKELGGPLTFLEIELLLKWLEEEAGIEKSIALSREPVSGDIELGKKVYQTNCAVCHGNEGEGISAPALGNPMLLATATDEFLKYAIKEGRDGTPMLAFKDSLSTEEIDGVTAFLRSRASGWNVPNLDSITEPKPADFILNPNGKVPDFKLREGRFVSAKQVNKALQDSARIVILDARSKVAWRQLHIPGSLPVPYYDDPAEFTKHVPNDPNTWIVVYCACPHAASGRVVDKFNKLGYMNTAILDEGVLIWAQLGYPVSHGN
tara:strand:- start:6545 stop:8629 length:2085 start_codon:yes stop_codon:yes gene_type:complete